MPASRMSTPHSRNNAFSSSNPFDSASDSEEEPTGEYNVSQTSYQRQASISSPSAAMRQYENDFRDSGGLDTQSVQDLENYAVFKAEKTTEKVNDCLKIAEDIKEDAARILVTLHQQGEQISRTHSNIVNVDHDLTRGEKLLSSLGGFFSRSWKLKSYSPIKGPAFTSNDGTSNRLGTSSGSSQKSNPRQCLTEPKSTLKEVEVEKVKQDDKLSDLSDLLGQLKEMAIDMGSEIERQNAGLCDLHDDVDTINVRVKGANFRARRLLGK